MPQTLAKKPIFFPLTQDNVIMTAKSMTFAQSQVYWYVKTLVGPFEGRMVEISIKALAADLGLNRSTVSRALKFLRENGFLDVEAVKVRLKVSAPDLSKHPKFNPDSDDSSAAECDSGDAQCDRAIALCNATITSPIYIEHARVQDFKDFIDLKAGEEKISEGNGGSSSSLASLEDQFEFVCDVDDLGKDTFSAVGFQGRIDVEAQIGPAIGFEGDINVENSTGSATGFDGDINVKAYEGSATGFDGVITVDAEEGSAMGFRGAIDVQAPKGVAIGFKGTININKPNPEELAEVARQLRELRINPDEHMAVVRKYWPNVFGALAYMREAFTCWAVKPYKPASLFVVACQKGRKPEMHFAASGTPVETNPPTNEQLDQLAKAKDSKAIYDHYLSTDGIYKVVLANNRLLPWWEFLKDESPVSA